jgi:hypothetical protein
MAFTQADAYADLSQLYEGKSRLAARLAKAPIVVEAGPLFAIERGRGFPLEGPLHLLRKSQPGPESLLSAYSQSWPIYMLPRQILTMRQ